MPCVAHLSPEKRRECWGFGWGFGKKRVEEEAEEEEERGDDGRESVPLHAHYHLFIWKTSLHRYTAG